MTRLNKHIALILGVSRREADTLIEKKTVKVNGEVARLGQQIDESSEVEVGGKKLDKTSKLQYIALNKPVGYVSSRHKQGESPTIYSLLPPELHPLKLVGRLDRDSSGIILLTNDGDFAHSMTHPSFSKVKIYEVELDKPLEPLHQQMISDHGIQLEDGVSQFMIEKLDTKGYRITMKEGRNRQIRRTFGSLGYTVTKLHRTNFGNFSLENLNLQQGKWCIVTL